MTRQFRDIDSFIRFMEDRVIPELPEAVHRGVEDGANRIKLITQAQLGHYLEGDEPGLPTAPLADATQDDRARRGFPPDEPGLVTGEMRNSYGVRISNPALDVDASIGSDDIKAAAFETGRTIIMQNGGVNFQPPRPELSVAAIRQEERVVNGIANMVVRTLSGRPLPNRVPSDDELTAGPQDDPSNAGGN